MCVNVLLTGAVDGTGSPGGKVQRRELKRNPALIGAGYSALITEEASAYGFLMYSSHMPLSSCFTDSIVKPLFSQ